MVAGLGRAGNVAPREVGTMRLVDNSFLHPGPGGVVGYHARLTRERSRVRSSSGVFFLLFSGKPRLVWVCIGCSYNENEKSIIMRARLIGSEPSKNIVLG